MQLRRRIPPSTRNTSVKLKPDFFGLVVFAEVGSAGATVGSAALARWRTSAMIE